MLFDRFSKSTTAAGERCLGHATGAHLGVDVWGDCHGWSLAVGAAGLVVCRLVPDHPLVPFFKQRPPQLQFPQRPLPICARSHTSSCTMFGSAMKYDSSILDKNCPTSTEGLHLSWQDGL